VSVRGSHEVDGAGYLRQAALARDELRLVVQPAGDQLVGFRGRKLEVVDQDLARPPAVDGALVVGLGNGQSSLRGEDLPASVDDPGRVDENAVEVEEKGPNAYAVAAPARPATVRTISSWLVFAVSLTAIRRPSRITAIRVDSVKTWSRLWLTMI